MLTRKQRELLVFIRDYQEQYAGVSPSYDEMRTALRFRSKSGVNRLVVGLEERGMIERLPHRARAILITRKGRLAISGNGDALSSNDLTNSDLFAAYLNHQLEVHRHRPEIFEAFKRVQRKATSLGLLQ